jgi:prevent-host-death family protein
MKSIGATEFKTHCLALLDQVARDHEELLILKRGKPIARLVPVGATAHESPQQTLRGTMLAADDLVEPPLSAEAWEAER